MAISVRRPIRPLRGIEVHLRHNVAREGLSPLLPQALVMLGDDETSLLCAMAVTNPPR
jgi:hypothetical protein